MSRQTVSHWYWLGFIAAVLFWGSIEIISAAMSYEPGVQREVQDWRPPLNQCPQDVKLWECIRHAMYKGEI